MEAAQVTGECDIEQRSSVCGRVDEGVE